MTKVKVCKKTKINHQSINQSIAFILYTIIEKYSVADVVV